MTKEEFLYRSAKLISYPTWIAANAIGILLAAGVLEGRAWLVTALILLSIAMPVGVKLSRLELTYAMVAVFRTGVDAQRKRDLEEMYGSMKQSPSTHSASESKLLQEDVAAMIADTGRVVGLESDQLARAIITVVRERVLRELSSYARENIR